MKKFFRISILIKNRLLVRIAHPTRLTHDLGAIFIKIRDSRVFTQPACAPYRALITQFTINLNNPIAATLTQSEITPIIQKLALITGLIFCLLYFIAGYFGEKIVLQRIIYDLRDDEYIVFKHPFKYVEAFLLSFVTGGFLGTFILPFILYPNIQYIEPFNKSFLPLLIIIEIILIEIMLISTFWKLVVTNQRIIGTFGFRFFDKINNKFLRLISGKPFDSINIEFSDINSMKIKTNLYKSLIIGLNNGTHKTISSFKNIEEIKSYIESKFNSIN